LITVALAKPAPKVPEKSRNPRKSKIEICVFERMNFPAMIIETAARAADWKIVT
jgi:hypothetical protein